MQQPTEDPPVTESAAVTPQNSRKRPYKRNYQACALCRQRKIRCDLGSLDDPQPPCQRCRRARKECVFEEDGRSLRPVGPAFGLKRRSQDIQPGESESEQTGADTLNTQPEQTQSRDIPAFQTSRVNDSFDDPSRHGEYLPNPAFATQSPMQQSRPSQTHRGHSTSPNDRIVNTVVRNSHDALRLLFDAAQSQRTPDAESNGHRQNSTSLPEVSSGTPLIWSNIQSEPAAGGISAFPQSQHHGLSPANHQQHMDIEAVWSEFYLCQERCLTPTEVVFLIDYFFVQLNTHSPIMEDYYRDPRTHSTLLTEEPLLCCTILCIATRYAVLPGPGAHTRGYQLHSLLFRHVQAMIQRTVWGVEERSVNRTLGSIESLLLLTEWHPRALHFPHEWDVMKPTLVPRKPQNTFVSNQNQGTYDPPKKKYQADQAPDHLLDVIVEASRRSDQMSWMLTGLAMSLAHEIGVFDDDEREDANEESLNAQTYNRKLRVQKTLYILPAQLATRLGKSMNMLPTMSFATPPAREQDQHRSWHSAMEGFIKLIKLSNAAYDMLYVSTTVTKRLLQKDRYADVLEQLGPLFDSWWRTYDNIDVPEIARITLHIEYYHLRISSYSIVLQALVERSLSGMNVGYQRVNRGQTAKDLGLIKEVTFGCGRILELAVHLHLRGVLRNCTVTVFGRIITAAMFSLKIIGLNLKEEHRLLSLLTRVMEILSQAAVDDMHLSARYAILLERLTVKAKQRCRSSNLQPTSAEQLDIVGPGDTVSRPQAANIGTSAIEQPTFADSQWLADDGSVPDLLADTEPFAIDWNEWLAFQLDPSLAALNGQ